MNICKITESTGSLEETSCMQSQKQNNGKQKADIQEEKTELGELIVDSERRRCIQDRNLKLVGVLGKISLKTA